MVDITHKSPSSRKAIAQAIVRVSSKATIDAIMNKTVPKGDVLECARVAGLFAAKRTSDMIPDCHPLPIEYTKINYEIQELEITVFVEIKTIYKTGVEVEAMHAASVVALTMYDMLKPIDKQISIEKISLTEKRGGKSDIKKRPLPGLRAAVVVCSDSISRGDKEDRAGKAIQEKLISYGLENIAYSIIPDEQKEIENAIAQSVEQKLNLLIFTGGTGLSNRDVTPESVIPFIDKRIPGVEEAIRNYGQQRTPYAMLSRSVVGFHKDLLILTLPGSTNGASESMDAVFPAILHVFSIHKGGQHD